MCLSWIGGKGLECTAKILSKCQEAANLFGMNIRKNRLEVDTNEAMKVSDNESIVV